jgi:hypothetical protein
MKLKGTCDYDLFYDPSYCYPVVTSHRDQKELRCSGISPGILCGHFSNVLTTMFSRPVSNTGIIIKIFPPLN